MSDNSIPQRPGDHIDQEYQVGSEFSDKKRYTPPLLKHEAHVRDITMGTTGGVNESGGNGDGWHWEAGTTGFDESDKKSQSGYWKSIFD